jgi:translation initiation factor 5A
MSTYDEEFENVNSGASLTTPISAGSIKKGGHILIDGHPCKVMFFQS